jgi:ankyrin repeat and LEM domain-containing protein 1
LTPLHIACIWGREKIVKLLLEHGGNVDLESEENQTPITYAIKEDHFEVIDTIKKFVFEKKLKKKTRKNILQHEFEELKYTPNRINYNFDASSPYYINITHRRHKTSDKPRKIFFPENDDEVEDEYNNQKNLFELTERNVKEFSKQMNTPIVVNKFAITKRNSYIRNWKDSIKQIRRTCSKNDIDYINYLNKCNNVTL